MWTGGDPVPHGTGHGLWSHGWNLRVTKVMPVNTPPVGTAFGLYNGGTVYTPQNCCLEASQFPFSTRGQKGIFSKNFKLIFTFKWLTKFVSKFYM